MTNRLLGNLFVRAVGGRGGSLAAPVSLGVLHATRNLVITEEDQIEAEEVAEFVEDSFEGDVEIAAGSAVEQGNRVGPIECPIQSQWARRELEDFRRQGPFRRDFWAMTNQQQRQDNDGGDNVTVVSPFADTGESRLLRDNNIVIGVPHHQPEPSHWTLPQ